jgi:Homeodomain-like domain
MRGPRPTPCIFPGDFLQEARHTVRQRTAALQDVQRFRLVLMLHEDPGISNEAASQQVGLSARQVRRWRQRWAEGDFSVQDRAGRGRKAAFSPSGPRPRDLDRL